MLLYKLYIVYFLEDKNLNNCSIMETRSADQILESVNEILWCDHSNETSSAVLLHGTICFSIFYIMLFENFLKF